MNAHNTNNNLPKPDDSEPDDVRSRQLDNEFADLTDTLLAGRDVTLKMSDDLHDLALTVRQLKTLINDTDQPSAAFRSHLARRLNTEWEQNERARRSRIRPLLSRSRLRPFMVLAAALVVLIAAATIIGSQLSTAVSPGLADGTITVAFVIVIGLFVAALIIVGLRGPK